MPMKIIYFCHKHECFCINCAPFPVCQVEHCNHFGLFSMELLFVTDFVKFLLTKNHTIESISSSVA